jgi:hypothetical protein
MMTYIGTSTKPETTFSDIRTIAIVLVSLLLPSQFIFKQLIKKIGANKFLLAFVSILMIFASLRTIYEVYPKSIHDPIYVVEDERLGSTAIYLGGEYINSYYKTGGIIADYKTINRIGILLPYPLYEKRLINETTLTDAFLLFPLRSILVFNIAGIRYLSTYHTSEAYIAAYNFGLMHNRLYDNGVILIISHREKTSKS